MILWVAVSTRVTADGKTLFAANSGNNTLSVVDTTTQKVTSTIPVGKQPYGAALSPDGKFVYSGNLGDNSVSVIDVPTRKVIATVTGFNEPRQAIVFTADNRYAYRYRPAARPPTPDAHFVHTAA